MPCFSEIRNEGGPVFVFDLSVDQGVEKELIAFVVVVLFAGCLVCHNVADETFNFADMLIDGVAGDFAKDHDFAFKSEFLFTR